MPIAGSGCAAPAAPPPPSAASGEMHLNDMPVIQRARAHRELGIRAMEKAYASTKDITRQERFREAMTSLELATSAYHDALVTAPPRYHPVIDSEIEAVAGLMRQIQRDREPPSGA